MSLREFVPLVGNICDLSIVVAVNILLLELWLIPPLFVKSNFFIYVMIVVKLVTMASMLSHMEQSTI
jgi:hypothetical protein